MQSSDALVAFRNLMAESNGNMMPVLDSMGVLSGKWKISIISSICNYNKRRFSDILGSVEGITDWGMEHRKKIVGV